MLYAITATREETRDGWTATRQLPTFYLDSNVQGIVSEDHAERIAADLLYGAAGAAAGLSVTFHVTAVVAS